MPPLLVLCRPPRPRRSRPCRPHSPTARRPNGPTGHQQSASAADKWSACTASPTWRTYPAATWSSPAVSEESGSGLGRRSTTKRPPGRSSAAARSAAGPSASSSIRRTPAHLLRQRLLWRCPVQDRRRRRHLPSAFSASRPTPPTASPSRTSTRPRAAKTMLLGLHEQSQSLQLSTDAGKIVEEDRRQTARRRQQSQHRSDSCSTRRPGSSTRPAGSRRRRSASIAARTAARRGRRFLGATGPAGQPLVASDGAIYWQRLTAQRPAEEPIDHGKDVDRARPGDQQQPDRAARQRCASPAFATSQVMVSADGGAGAGRSSVPPVPFRPNGITVQREKGKSFYASRRLADNMKKPPQLRSCG